jgi:hypothetical protein
VIAFVVFKSNNFFLPQPSASTRLFYNNPEGERQPGVPAAGIVFGVEAKSARRAIMV